MNPPKGIDPKVWQMAYGFAFNWEENETLIEQMAEELAEIISKAIEAEHTKIEELLKDPAAVRVNFLRGGIACQHLIDEAVEAEREECAKIAEDRAFWAGEESAIEPRRDRKMACSAQKFALTNLSQAIRNRSNTTTERNEG